MLLRNVVVGMTVVAGCAVAAPAVAYTQSDWAPSGTPLVAKEDKKEVAKAYGHWTLKVTSNGLRSHGHSKLYDVQNDGNGVYSDMKTQSNAGNCFSSEYITCTQAWYDWKHDETDRHYGQKWSTYQP